MNKVKYFSSLCKISNWPQIQNVRFHHIQATKLCLHEFGDPSKVVKKEQFELNDSDVENGQVLIKMIQSPINPADINTIQGVYGVKPKLPFTLGNEGFGVIIKIGSSVKNFKVGDWVIPDVNAWGTWRSHAIEEEGKLRKISNTLSPSMAATISVNPCTAYRMLKDFETLKEGDTVIQNASNSAVGQHVIQIANYLGLKTVNIVRKREGIEKVVEHLKSLGADHVLTEEELRNTKLFESELPPPKLALNCVSGKSTIGLVKILDENGTLVTYGGMSRQPLVVPTSAFIFKNIKLVGFWMTRWNWNHKNDPERDQMLKALCDMAIDGALKPPKHELIHVGDYQNALARASDPSGGLSTKLIFKFD